MTPSRLRASSRALATMGAPLAAIVAGAFVTSVAPTARAANASPSASASASVLTSAAASTRAAAETQKSPFDLDVRVESLATSVHAGLRCAQCHADMEKRAPGMKLSATSGSVNDYMCRGCHANADAAYDRSAHGLALASGTPGVARCQDCHGAHDVKRAGARDSAVSKRNAVATCTKCHLNPAYAEVLGAKQALVRQYAESIHGRELLENGLVKAPSCVDCHCGHSMTPTKGASKAARTANVVSMCSRCHAGIATTFAKSAHGLALARGDADAPGCQSCHTAHAITERGESFKLRSDRQCGGCHRDRFEQHLQTYHGRAHALGGAEVAACYDCHGSHDVLATKDAASKVSPTRKLDTCRTCHVGAAANLAGYLPHGDPRDRLHYPKLYWTYRPMTWLLGGAFGLFGLQAIAHALRRALDFLRDPPTYRESRRRARRDERAAFGPPFRGVDVFCYALLLLAFAIQVATGIPLGYPRSPFAKAIFSALGGADAARGLHRIGAVLAIACLALHLATLIAPLWRRRAECLDARGHLDVRRLAALVFGPDSPMPNRRDPALVWAHVKWLLGRGPEPRYERYPFWEKLDWIATFVGMAIVGASGFVLWAPGQALKILPGWAVNVAQVVHREQASLILLFLVTAHVVHLAPRLLAMRRPRRAPARTDVVIPPEIEAPT